MSKTIRDLFSEYEIELILAALLKAEKHALTIAHRPLQGFGSATEKEKKREWAERADDYSEVRSKISEEWN